MGIETLKFDLQDKKIERENLIENRDSHTRIIADLFVNIDAATANRDSYDVRIVAIEGEIQSLENELIERMNEQDAYRGEFG